MAEADIYKKLAARHGHYCPMSTLGLRIGLEAVRRLDEESVWNFCYQARTCAIDGIELALENSSLSTPLQVFSLGQHLLLCRCADGKELSFFLSQEAMLLAKHYNDLEDEDKKGHLEMLRTIDVDRIIEIAALGD